MKKFLSLLLAVAVLTVLCVYANGLVKASPAASDEDGAARNASSEAVETDERIAMVLTDLAA